jgi:hypothetical protein
MLENFNLFLSATLGVGFGVVLSTVVFAFVAFVLNKYFFK